MLPMQSYRVWEVNRVVGRFCGYFGVIGALKRGLNVESPIVIKPSGLLNSIAWGVIAKVLAHY